MSGYIGFVDYQLINTINLNCIAAAVIGGTTFAGGEGGVFRTTIGVVVLACLLSFMLLLNTGNAGQLILEGAVILGAVWLQTGTRSIRYRRRIAVAGIGEASIDNEVNVAPSHAVGVGIDKPTDNRGI
jgi:ribose/xylose/arabinose/galactoside ABC-type transport system permease subunit